MNQGLGGATPEAAGRDAGCEGEEWLGMGVARQTGSQVQATQGLTGLTSSGKGKSEAMGFSREMTRFLLSF